MVLDPKQEQVEVAADHDRSPGRNCPHDSEYHTENSILVLLELGEVDILGLWLHSVNRTKRVAPKVHHTTNTVAHLLEGLSSKVVVEEEVIQSKDSMEDTSCVVSCKVVVVVVAWENVGVRSYTAVQKTAVGAHPPD